MKPANAATLPPPARPVGRARLALVVVVALTAVLVLLAGRNFAGKVRDFQPLGFSAAPRGEGFVVIGAPVPSSGLVAGDVVLLVNGQQPRSHDDLARALRQRARSELVVERDGELRQVPFLRPELAVDWTYLALALAAIAYLLIGGYTLSRSLSAPSLLFHLWCLCSAAVYLLSPVPPLDGVGRASYLVEELARLLLPPLTLHFFLVFPRGERPPRGLARLLPFLYLPAAVLFALQLDLALFDGGIFAGAPTDARLLLLDRVELGWLGSFVLLSTVVLAAKLRRTKTAEARRQLWWITLGMAVGYAPFLLFYLAPRLIGFDAPAALRLLAVLPLLLVPLSFAYAILRYRLWDIAIIVRQLVTYSLTVLVGIFGFSLLGLLIDRGVPEGMTLARQLLSVLSALVVGAVMIPTSQGIGATLQRVHYGDRFRSRRALARLGHDLLHERDLARLASGLLGEAQASLGLERIELYLANERANDRVNDRGNDGELMPYGEGESLAAAGLPAAIWEQPFTHLAAAALPEETDRSSADRLLRRGFRYAFPLVVRDRHVGLVATGYKAGQVPLSSDDALLLRQLFNQAALAIENAQLVEQLRRQLVEVTALQRFSESIIESAPAAMAVIDSDGRVVSANAALATLTGCGAGTITGRALHGLLSLDRLPEPMAPPLDFLLRPPGAGQDRLLQIHVAPLDAAAERHSGAAAGARHVAVVHDVTERVLLERRLREQERLAALGVMAASVAHEVNTPLTGISSYAQMLLREIPDGDRRHSVLRKIERQTFRAARIVNGLLQLVRGRATVSDEAEAVDLGAVGDDCVDLLAERLAGRRVAVVWRQRPEGPLLVRGNEAELHQVMTNLLQNAIDAAAERGGGTIGLTLGADGERVRLAVDDDGPGIASLDLGRIFEPFFTTKSGHGGTGLGLAISKEIVERHRGELSAHNRALGGAVFTVLLPRWQVAPAPAARPGKGDPEP